LITLFVDGYFVSPLDASCVIALEHKGVEYTLSRALLRDGQGVPAALGTKTLISRIPALQHDQFFVSESLAIIDYIEDVFPTPRLYPADPRGRARARQLMSYLRFEFDLLREECPWWTCVYKVEPPALSSAVIRQATELVATATRMIESPEFAEWSIAHVDLALMLMRLPSNGITLPEPLARMMIATQAMPVVRTYLDLPRPPNPPPRRAGAG